MTLARKILLAIFGIFVLTTIMNYVVLKTLIYPSYVDLEQVAAGRPTVVVIDEDQASLDQIDAVLTEAGYAVVLTDNAETGLQLARLTHPNVVLLDIDDWDAMTALISDEAFANCHVVIQSQNEYLKSKFGSKVDGVLGKPVDEKNLTHMLATLGSREGKVLPAKIDATGGN